MTPREVVRRLTALGCTKVRQKGSHATYMAPDGKCWTTVAIHEGRDIPAGTLRAIERELEPCLGRKWLLGTK
ncbi:MAG: type II toxin-antitoxin system HicA family toxin [Polyangiaceae bacterium]|nr:type II toxin-antitoxin system HicA family toxin [Polyangiaceae bacterium]